jgi:hypothetical protein
MSFFSKILFPIPFFAIVSSCSWIVSHPVEDIEVIETSVEVIQDSIKFIEEEIKKKSSYELPSE